MQGDLVQRLRDRAYGCKVPDPLVEEAADEIERLRPAYATAVQRLASEIDRLRLTDAERTLIYRIAEECEGGHPRAWTNRTLTPDDRATLCGLLERLA